MPWSGTTVNLSVTPPMSTPPLPGTPVPHLYPWMMASFSSLHLMALSWDQVLTSPPALTSHSALERATTLPSCIMGQFTKILFPTRLWARVVMGGRLGGRAASWRIVFSYLLSVPKQFSPTFSSLFPFMGRTFMLGKPGNGIFVPATTSGLKVTPDLSLSFHMAHLELHMLMSLRPISRLALGTSETLLGSCVYSRTLPKLLRFFSSVVREREGQNSAMAALSLLASMKGRRLTPSQGLRLPFISTSNSTG
mmetsp:Transcript_27054/g.53960  ORF Transcript_27054/g.53960 Transcript_27054/m.53960 type:complete len:251 (-) Transcript_27054:627-1379(-)